MIRQIFAPLGLAAATVAFSAQMAAAEPQYERTQQPTDAAEALEYSAALDPLDFIKPWVIYETEQGDLSEAAYEAFLDHLCGFDEMGLDYKPKLDPSFDVGLHLGLSAEDSGDIPEPPQ